MLIISTAGHIDHGKSSLITALNGFVGDSTPEEIRRKITIDLSFSNMQGISFVDVPGHENLLKTMICGVQSEYAMLVIDINEGAMPQTFEHIFVLKIMACKNIILVLNKIDKCDDIEGKKAAILSQLDFTPSAVFCVSATQNLGIDELRKHLLSLKESSDFSKQPMRFYVDRIFSVKGSGMVATGLLKSGMMECKNYLNEDAKSVAIKSIQVHSSEHSSVKAPARVAINYKGELKVGDTLYQKGFLKSCKEIYAKIITNSALVHDEVVQLCIAGKQLNAKYLEFGEFAKFELKNGIKVCFDEPFIVLKNSRAVAGGRVLSSVNEPLKKAKMLSLLRVLEQKDFVSAFEILNQNHFFGFGLFCAPQRFNLSLEAAIEYAQNLNQIVDKKGACVYSQKALEKTKELIENQFSKNIYSLQSAKSLAKSLGIDEFLCNLALKNLPNLVCENGLFHLLGVDAKKIIASNKDLMYAKINLLTPLAPYIIYDELNLDREQGDKILKELTRQNLAVRLAHNYFISKRALDEFIASIKGDLANGIGVQELKASHNLSRKYAIALLEYIDALPNTTKIDNKRFLKQN